MKPKLYKELLRYGLIFLGASLLATGVTMFLATNQIVSGGTPGMAILINYFSDYPIGTVMFAINVPMVLLSIRYIGKGFTLRTLFAVTVSSAKALDLLMSGRPSKKVLHISSDKVELLRRQIVHKLGQDGIIVKGLVST